MHVPMAALGMLAVSLTSTPTDRPQAGFKPPSNRFQMVAPIPSLPSVVLDVVGNGVGIAQQTARARNLQGRLLWIDATANIDRYNTAPKIENLVRKIKDIGFNTIVLDIKPIVGYTIYPSKLTDKLTMWKGQRLPLDFDPLRVFVAECKRNKIKLIVSMNAFSEGHRMAKMEVGNPNSPFGKPGPGYERPDQQTVLYEPAPFLKAPFADSLFPVNPVPDAIPANGDAISVFRSVDLLSKAQPRSTAVVLDDAGVVVTVRERTNFNIVGVPSGGSILVGTGEAGRFLSQNCRVGTRVSIVARPEFVQISERPEQQIPLMMNPHHPAVQQRVLSFLTELLTQYDVDGVVFDDRLRFGGMNADFSELTRGMFETLVGEKLKWPNDVFEFTFRPDLSKGIKPGKYYDAWMAWRAATLRDWVVRARHTIRTLRKDVQFGIYAGSWFGEYHKYGANYSSENVNAGFAFLTDAYRKTGFADQLDFLITGCYYRVPTIVDAMSDNRNTGHTVEAAGQLTNRLARDEAWAYAGIMLQDYYGRPKALEAALQAATGSTQGVMVFDLSHRIEEFWPIFERAFKERKTAPHEVKDLLATVRGLRGRIDAMGVKEPPIFMREGAAGAGQ